MSAPFFASVDVHQEFNQTPPGFGSEAAPVSTYRFTEPVPTNSSYHEKDDFWVNSFNVERATEHNINNSIPLQDSNDPGSFTQGKTDLNQLPPIPPVSTGQGLPYAPVDWPNPGDVWSWRVGSRISKTGFHQDRFLILPRRLWKRGGTKSFGSKPSVASYIQAEFPDTDLNAFFASFSWKIPSLFQPMPKEPVREQHKEETERNGNAQKDGNTQISRLTQKRNGDTQKEVTSRYMQKKKKATQTQANPPSEKKPEATSWTSEKRTKEKTATTPIATPLPPPSNQKSQQSSEKHNGFVDLNFLNDGSDAGESAWSNKKRPTGDLDDGVSIPHIYVSPINGVLAVSHPPVDINPDEFDKYLNSLDNLLTWPPDDEHEQGSSFPVREYELAEARMKLSSLLVKGFPALFYSNNVAELANLAAKLKKDPRLHLEEMARLKLIEEIPLFSEVFRENRQVIEEADKFFTTLEFNRAKVASLKYEYSGLKDKVSIVQMDLDSDSEAIRQIDEQISALKARRDELSYANEDMSKERDNLNYAQKMVANSIPRVAQEVQTAMLKKSEWKAKKEEAVNREEDILAKFASLKGFYL